ncbi:hypothetical protein GWK47_055210 [Chionoecetes opilio]|uniref:Uncharacterized protein n=1 Tax=Chionoecetes opilio TaxID=41210 RepID=A0A8J4Y3V2_CHIOP|nr:hypothetical protein GWK47_055210 [Chionoecetes opilio]
MSRMTDSLTFLLTTQVTTMATASRHLWLRQATVSTSSCSCRLLMVPETPLPGRQDSHMPSLPALLWFANLAVAVAAPAVCMYGAVVPLLEDTVPFLAGLSSRPDEVTSVVQAALHGLRAGHDRLLVRCPGGAGPPACGGTGSGISIVRPARRRCRWTSGTARCAASAWRADSTTLCC